MLNRLHAWRQRLYPLVSSTPSKIPLESLSRVLSEIEYQSYDEIDIFGQYNMVSMRNSLVCLLISFSSVTHLMTLQRWPALNQL